MMRIGNWLFYRRVHPCSEEWWPMSCWTASLLLKEGDSMAYLSLEDTGTPVLVDLKGNTLLSIVKSHFTLRRRVGVLMVLMGLNPKLHVWDKWMAAFNLMLRLDRHPNLTYILVLRLDEGVTYIHSSVNEPISRGEENLDVTRLLL